MDQEKQADIKIFVVCHKPSFVPDNPLLLPIQVGASLASQELSDMLHDNTGDNISDKNKSYCELTAQYWAWKNASADYYGFFHYRRYLAFNPELKKDDGWGNIAYERITTEVEQEIGLNPEQMRKYIEGYDIVTVRGRQYPRIKVSGTPMDIYHEYGVADFQHRKDLDTALAVLKEKYPEYQKSAETYMHSTIAYECNMFIMEREEYLRYCAWLFDILFETEKRLDLSDYSVEEYRVMGYLAERLFGIYYTHRKAQAGVRCMELPKTLFHDTEPKRKLAPVFEEAVPIVLAANEKFAPYLAVMIQSIVEHADSERNYDLIVLNHDITEQSQEQIRYPFKNKKNISLRFIRVSQYFDREKLFVDQHLSVETYYRLIIPEIMPAYDKILYLDCDMVAEYDVAELYDFDLQGTVIAGAKDIDESGNVKLGDWRKYATEELGLDSPYDYFQAGVLVISLDALRKITTSKEMIELALSKSWRCHDQDVLNVICKNRVVYLPQRWNLQMNWQEGSLSRMQIMKMAPRMLYQEYMEARKNPYIVHYSGYQKPWDVADCDLGWYFWGYAQRTMYYPILQKKVVCFLREQARTYATPMENSKLRRIANLFLPYGSRRREVLKVILKKRNKH